MKAFLAAVLALAVLSIGADFYWNQAGFAAEEVFAGENVRLGD